jgi:hypothetical protein
MGIFKKITKALKKAAPVIGAGIGMYYGGASGAALGSGLGSLAGGRSTEEALRNAALAGGAAYMAGGSGFGQKVAGQDYFSDKTFDFGKSPIAGFFGDSSKTANNVGYKPGTSVESVPASTSSNGIMDFVKDNKFLAATALGGLGALYADDPEETAKEQRDFAEGKWRGGDLTTLDDEGKSITFDGSDPDQRQAYFAQVRKNQKAGNEREVVTDYDRYGVITAAGGGEINGPGTGTSDSVPARLSDGEFVVTADAVRGAGGGDRNVGAARMYDMMSQLERAA